MTSAGAPVDIVGAEHGKDYADEMAFAVAFKVLARDVFAAKQTALACVQKQFEADLGKGYHDPLLNITVAIEDADRRQFNDLDTHLARKRAPEGFPITIKLMDGTLRPINSADFHQLIIRAGDYYLALWTDLQQKKSSL